MYACIHTFMNGWIENISYRRFGDTNFFIVPSQTPRIVDVQVINSTALLVYWRPLDQQYANGILNAYKVRYLDMSDETQTILSVSPRNFSAAVGRLTEFTNYKVRVCACTSKGCGKWSLHKAVQTFEDSKYIDRQIILFILSVSYILFVIQFPSLLLTTS